MFAQQWVLGVNYPADRAALFFFPLLLGTLVHLNFKGTKYLALTLALWFPMDLISSGNFSYIRLWPHERVSYENWKAAADLIDEYPPSLSTAPTRQSVWTFYSLIHQKPLYANYVDFPSQWADLVWASPEEQKQLDLNQYRVLSKDSISIHSLLKRRSPFIERTILDTHLLVNQEVGEYYTLLEYDISTINAEALAFYSEIKIESTDPVVQSYIFFSLVGDDGISVIDAKHNLGILNENWMEQDFEKMKLFLPLGDSRGQKLMVFIHNPYLEKHRLKSFHLKMVGLNPPKINS
jgi:hypothetical protein